MSSAAERLAGEELRGRLRRGRIDVREIASFLDSLGSLERLAAVRSLGRREQRALYGAAEGAFGLRLVDLVPESVPDLTPVRHHGRNTLPLFTHFEKRFCRPRGADRKQPGELYGFNFQALSFATGPGYFVASEDPARGEVRIDYRRLPPERPESWPEVRRNEVGLARFVYGFLEDTLRRVSEHVSIGSAARHGRDLGSWFVLCREAGGAAAWPGPG
jgi:hypothetical protein